MFRSAKHWVWLILCWLVLAGQVWAMPCDVDNDGDIDLDDLNLIQKAILARAKVSGANDPRDADGNGVINSIDGRLCALRCTRAKCSTVNQAPFANAGPDQSVKVGDLVVLSGAASSDPDGDALRYTWTFNNRPLGSLASLIEAATVAPRFTADRPGQYLIQLIVSDGKLSSVPDTVVISTENSRPIANAGPDQSVRVGTLVMLNGGRSTDVDGDPLTYTWRLASVPPGSGATLGNPDSVNPTLLIDQPGSYLIALTVSDGKLVSLPATVAVTTENSPPVANPGPNQSIPLGAVITLDGSRSSDVDGDPLTFRWSLLARPSGSAAVLSNANSVHPGFTADLPGTYVAQLMVNDGTADSAPASVTLTTANAAPMADAGPDQTVPLGSLVTLDGSASRDPEGAVLTLTWSLIGKPPGSSASLTGSNTFNPAFTADRPGNYIAQLIVSDGQLASAPDTVTISTANSRPVADAGTPQSVAAGVPVSLDGSASRDADGDALTFAWSLTTLPPGSHAVMTGADLVNPGFVPDLPGTYIAQLIVSDGQLSSLPVTVVISVSAANRKPVAVAEAIPTKTTVGSSVVLRGTASSDPDGDPLTWSWSIALRPGGSNASIVSPTAAQTSFVPDVPGVYTIQLIVRDGKIDSVPALVVVEALAANHPPVITSTALTTATIGQPYSYPVVASDPDVGDVLTWSLVTAPSGMSIDAASGLITWTPSEAQVASQAVSVRVTDQGGLPATQDFTILVAQPNHPPLITFAGFAPQWTQLVPTGTAPVPRYAGSLYTYDEVTDRLIIFGGQDAITVQLNEVWVLSHASGLTGTPAWTKLEPTGSAPSPRPHFASAYDATANRLIVYGGCTGFCSPLSDAWVLTHANGLGGQPEWLPLPASNALAYGVGGYDPISNRLVVFGGSTAGKGSDTTDVKVLLDANGIGDPRWLTLSPEGARPPVRGHSQPGVYDPLSNVLIVFGGQSTASSSYNYNDVWVLSNANGLGGVPIWTQLSPAGLAPIPRAHHTMAYDPNSNRLIVFGGYDGVQDSRLNDTWVLTQANGQGGTSEWIKLTSGATPAVASSPTAGYMKSSNRLIVALGISTAEAVLNDVWVLANASGNCTAGQPCTFKVTASDPDIGDTLRHSLDAAPPGMAIDAASGAIAWTPAIAQIGNHAVTVRVTDRGGLFTTQTLTATVAAVAVPNVVGLAPEWAESFITAADLSVGTKTSQGGAVTLNFDSLPSRQGWNFDGHTGGTEAMFSVADGVLKQNTSGGGDVFAMYELKAVDPRLPFQLATRIRVLEGPFVGVGLYAETDNEIFSFHLNPHEVLINGTSWTTVSTQDNTVFHDYLLERQGSDRYSLLVDGTTRLQDRSPISSPGTPHARLLLLGDPTITGGNARAEYALYKFTQPRVVGQNPPAGTLVPNKTAVDLTIVDGPATETVPNVIGLSQAVAEAAIVTANLKLGGVTSAPHPTIPAGQVSDQSPLPNIHVPKDTPVAIVMSTGPPAPVNVAPVITSTPLTAATVSQPYAYQVTASDANVGDVLTFSLPTAPAGMTINATTGLIAWTPTLAQLGSHSVTVRVTDAAGLFAEQSFTIAARVTNGGPVAVAGLLNAPGLPACVAPPAGLVSWYPGDGNSADIVGPNSPNSTIGNPQFVAGKVGQGIKFDGSTALIAPDDPSVNFGKNDSFTIDAWVRVDGQGGDNAANSVVDKLGPRVDGTRGGYVLDVLNPPFNPTGTWSFHFGLLQDHAANIGQDVFAKPVAYGEFHFVAVTVDRSGQTVSMYMDGVLQQQLSVEHVGDLLTTSRLFIGHQNLDWPGFNPMRPLKGVLDEAEIFNRALSQAEIQSLYLAGSAGKCKLRVGDTVRLDGTRSSDPDADALAYRWTLLARPADSTAALDNANAAQPTFVADRQGSYRLQLVVNDGVTDSAPSEISIAVMEGNRPPIALDDNYPVKLGQTLAVPAPGVMANDYDPDGNPLAAAKLSDPANGSLVFNSDGSFNYTPNPGVFGPGASAHALIGTTFMPGQPKSIDINPQTNRIYVTNLFAGTLAVIDGATGKVIALPTTNHSHIEEVAANLVTNRLYVTGTAINNYTSSSVQSNEVTVIDGATSTRIAAIPVGNQPGHLAVNAATNRIYVANVAGGSVSVIDGTSNAVLATVPVGREPRQVRVDARTNRIYALSTLDSNVTVIDGASNAVVATVPVGAGARFMAVDAEFERLHVVNGTDNTLTVIDTTLNAAIDTVTVGSGPTAIALHPTIDRLYVANGTGNSVSVLDRHSRANLGTLPVGTSPQSITVNPFSNRVYVANAGDNTVSVIDPATTTVSATVGVGRNPQMLAVNPLSDRLYTADADSHSVSVVHVGDRFAYKVNDGTTDSNAATVTVVIEPTSIPPVAASDRYTAQAGVLLTVPVPGVLGNDGDVAGKALSAVLIAGPAGGTLALNANGSFTYLPRNDFVGIDTFTYRASNGAEQSNVATVRVDVTGNRAPVITSTAVTSAMATQPYAYTVTATDPNPSDTLTFLLPTAPAGMSINATTGLITWTPTLAQVGIHPVTIRVTDQGGLFAEQGFTITVTAPGPGNQPPVITSTAPTAATAGTPYTYAVTATDPNPSDTLTYSLTTAPAGMTIAATTGLIQWTPTAEQAGDHPVEVKVQDSGGLFATQPFTLTVSATAVCVPPPAGLVSWWPGDGNTLDRAAANDGLAENGATFAAGLVGQAFRFDGVDDVIRVASSRTVSFGGAFTVEFWFNPTTAIGTSTPNQVLLAKGRYLEGSFNAPVAIQVLGGDGRLLVRMPPTPALVSTTTTWPAGTWQHVALSWDGARYRLYVNGIEEAGLDNAFSIIDSSDPITLGNADGFAAAGFAGLLDEPTLYNRALTPAEIATLHAARDLGKCTAGYSRADAGADQAVEVGATVTLDGSASRAFDGAPLTYQWTLTTRPADSAALLANPTTVSPTFIADKAGSYALELIVSNAGRASAPDSVSITAARVNHAPTISSTPITAATAGSAYTYPVAASDPDAGDTLTFSLPVAPAGMSINSASGLIQWTPTTGQIGSHNVTLRVQDPGGLFAPQSFVIVVVAAPVPVSVPNVVGQEQSSAQSAITAAALTVGTVTLAASETVPAGRVISQNPTAGTVVNSGSAVALVVSSGPAGPALASIRVTPIKLLILTGQSQAFVATGILANGSSLPLTSGLTWASSNPAVASIDSAGVVSALAEGSTTISVSQSGVTGSTTLNVAQAVADGTLPVAQITSPADGASVAAAVAIVGTASDANFLKYVIEIAPFETGVFSTLAVGTAPVSNGTLATLDPTTLVNDIYVVRLTVVDRADNRTQTEITLQLTRDKKVGNFTLAFQDVNVPMAGIPISVVRSYDSRDKTKGDFGIGWRLDVQSLRLRVVGVHGQGWEQVRTGDTLNRLYTLVPRGVHKVAITLPDGKVEEFDLALSPTSQRFVPIEVTDAVYAPRPLTRGSLRALGETRLVTFGATGPLDLLTESGLEVFNPEEFEYTTPEGQVIVLSRSAGVKQIRDRSGNTVSFAPGGITHSAGKSIVFNRDAQNRITTVTDPQGNVQSYAYDINGDLASHTDGEGRRTSFLYNYDHGLIEIQDPRGIHPIRNDYDEAGRLIRTTDAYGKAITYTHDLGANREVITDRLGNATVHVYDDLGNVTQTADALGGVTNRSYDARGNTLSEQDPLGRTRTYTYDGQDNRLTETDALGKTTAYSYNGNRQVLTVTDALGRTTSNAYDGAGNLTSTTDPAGQVTSYTYDARGLQLTRSDPLGNLMRYAYDAAGNLISETDALGRVTNYTYDANGNRLTQTTSRTTASGLETLVTTFAYDKANHLTQTTHPDGSLTRVAYNAIGKQSITTDALGRETKFDYDDMGRLTRTTYPDASSESSVYDAEGRRTGSTDRAGRTTTSTYDALGRLTATTYPDSTGSSTAYDAAGQVLTSTDARGNATSYVYDGAGRRAQVIDALGQATTFSYDDLGNQTRVTDANGNAVAFTYDANNRRTRTTYADSTFDQVSYDALGRQTAKTDQAGKTIQFAYDALGRLIRVTDALGQVTSYSYDEQGNQLTQTDGEGRSTSFAYDTMGRRTKRTLPLGQTEQMSYDADGNLRTKTDFNGRTTSYTYDSVNRLLRKTPDASLGQPPVVFSYTPSGQRASMQDASGSTTYSYDNRDRLLSKTTPQGALSYSYDAAGNLTSIHSNHAGGAAMDYSYDQRNRLASVTDAEGRVTTYGYDAVGNLAGFLYPNGVQTTYTYNPLNRLTNVTGARGATTIAGYTYTLGPAGNRTAVTEANGRRVDYTYDDLYRLKSETISADPAGPNGAIGYTYDKVGNRLTRISTVAGITDQSFEYDFNDRLGGEGYDDNGNTLTSGSKTFGYDFENHLTSADGGVSFVYNGDGIRVAKSAGGVTTGFLVDDRNPTGYAQVLEEVVGGALERSYTYGLKLVSQKQASGVSFYGYDGHGSVRYLTDASGAVTDTYSYEAFGNVVLNVGTTSNGYYYRAEALDANASAYYLRARYYDPATSRFRTTDPAEGDSSDPASFHRYQYATNDPQSNLDPSGTTTLADLSVRDVGLPFVALAGWQAPRGLSEILSKTRTATECRNCPTSSGPHPKLESRAPIGGPPNITIVLSVGGPETGGGTDPECHVNLTAQSEPDNGGYLNTNYHVAFPFGSYYKATPQGKQGTSEEIFFGSSAITVTETISWLVVDQFVRKTYRPKSQDKARLRLQQVLSIAALPRINALKDYW